MQINNEIRKKIVQHILSQKGFLGNYYDNSLLIFLNEIWTLKNIPSSDKYYSDIEGEIYQHMINNDDWTFEHLFFERLNIINGPEEIFIKFIEKMVHPETRTSRENIILYVSSLNKILAASPVKLILSSYFESLPVYTIKDKELFKDLPSYISENNIPFLSGESKSTTYPYFRLDFVNWDDFGNRTKMNLSYCNSDGKWLNIGSLKILCRNQTNTSEVISSNFNLLSNDYCSLGQSSSYYQTLKDIFGEQFQSILMALRDVAFFPKILHEFENDKIFEASLIRSNEVEKLMRTIRFTMENIDLNQRFKFNYSYTPPYATNEINLNFDFEYENEIQHRVYALIGKNGTGKTRILSSLVNKLSENKPSNIYPKKPLFAKVFSVSYSFFDKFDIPTGDASYNYVYCGLKNADGTLMTEDDLIIRFDESAEIIKRRNLMRQWRSTLRNFIPSELLYPIFGPSIEYIEEEAHKLLRKLSSGQSILVFIITEIIAQIRYNSLILYDEPENHLHPNAITQLMNTIYNLVNEFESFCIIATHSPLVIQEISSRNIYIIERDEEIAKIRKLQKEAFGENLTIITEEIFGNKETTKYHYSVLENLVSKNKTYEEIIDILKTQELPVTLSNRLYIKEMINNRSQNEEFESF